MTDDDVRVVRGLQAALVPPAEGLLAEYFDPVGRFAGLTFDSLGDADPSKVTAEDLLAVSTLDVSIKPLALRRLLGTDSSVFSGLLARLPVDCDLWDATDDVLDAADEADDWLRRLEGVHGVVASKILSRKRPRLVPVIDSVVFVQLGRPARTYKDIRRGLSRWLRNQDLQQRLSELSESLPVEVTKLRVLDVVLWMRGSGSRNAKAARTRQGL